MGEICPALPRRHNGLDLLWVKYWEPCIEYYYALNEHSGLLVLGEVLILIGRNIDKSRS
jgi:hypothetical protein